jgi:hypothetical protein
MSLEAHTQLQKLLDISEEAGQIITQQRILKSLAFGQMHGRFEAVNTAHYKTFRWIFGDSPESEDDKSSGSDDEDSPESEDEKSSGSEDGDSPGPEEEQSLDSEGDAPFRTEKAETSGAAYRLASESLIHWLSSGNRIYHISGKLGSGKSTLMKFLCEHKRTKAEL